MTKPKRVAIAALLGLAVSLGAAWLICLPRDPLFHGKPESQWIEHLAYNDDEQVKQWREFGAEGVLVLVRALQGANRPGDRIYRQTYRRMGRLLPGDLMRMLPVPRMDLTRGTRMKTVALLSRLGKDAKAATPVMIRALRDEDTSVRQIAINFFTQGEDQNAPLNQMDGRTKRTLLPELVRAMQDNNWGVRNNAVIALGYYSEQLQEVVPILTNALHDPVPKVRQLAAHSFNQVAPSMVVEAGVIPIVIGVLKEPDDQIAYRAAQLLGEMRKEPSLAVPALVEAVQGTNGLVASTAARALANFPDQAGVIVPVLLKAYHDTNSVVSRSASAGALKKIDPTAAAQAGVK